MDINYKYKLGTIVQTMNNKEFSNKLQWRVIEIVGNHFGVRYLCECINQPTNTSASVRHDFKEEELQKVEL